MPDVPRAAIVSASDLGNATPADAGRFRFGRQCRIVAPARFREVFAGRRALRGDHFVLHYLAGDRVGPRLGLVIPKKQARTAVLRNAIKREARESFRLQRTRLPAVDMVLRLALPLTGQKADAVSRAAWRAEIVMLFDRLVCKAAA